MKRLRQIGTTLCGFATLFGVGCGIASAIRPPAPSGTGLIPSDARLLSAVLWMLWSARFGWDLAVMRGGRRHAGAVPAAMGVATSLAVSAMELPFPSAGFVAYLSFIVIVPYLNGTAVFLAVAGLSALLHAGLLGLLGETGAVQYLSVACVVCLFGVVVQRSTNDWERQLALFDQARWAASAFVKSNLRMQDNIDRTAHETQVEDRLWMSRELHDSVGYSLTGALVQVMACQKVLAAGRQDTEQAVARLRGIEDTIRETLQDMRRRVSTLRAEASQADNGCRRWSRLCRAFADSTGIRVECTMPAELGTVSSELSDAVYRIIQEALTNAYRHGNADLVDVAMACEPERARILLRVSDNGIGAGNVVQGNGLRGMRERVQELGGEFAWQSAANKGFNIGVVIPWGGRTACSASGS